MHTLSTPLIIFLAVVAAVILGNIITWTIAGGSTLSSYVDPVTDQNTISANVTASERLHALAVDSARRECGCRCHSEAMFPGMRCLDCYGSMCDEGTQQ